MIGEADMPLYLGQAKLSQSSIKGLMANPQDRTEAISKLLESVGGRLHHYFFAFGEYDVVTLFEAPDNASAAGAMMAAVGAGGTSGTKTTVLMTMDEAVAAMKKAGSAAYQPPGA
jgi:uncharacterized protein with GYD domain